MAKRWKSNVKNPYNPDNYLYKRLTKLFSGPIVSYQRKNVNYLRGDKIKNGKKLFKDMTGKEFKKMSYDPLNSFELATLASARRAERYLDFDQMEFMSEIHRALDIFADEITYSNDFKKVIQIKCDNNDIKDLLETLFFDVLNIEHNLFSWVRTLCKYGDAFLYLDIDDEIGIKNAMLLPTPEIERIEGEDEQNPNYVQFQWNAAALTLENWQICHFRLLGNDKYTPYGTSVLDPIRRIWRQLTLLEDALMAYRIVRAPERRVFKIEVGGIPQDDVEQYMEDIVTSIKRHKLVDPETGRVDLKNNSLSIDEDYFFTQRNGKGSTVDTLAGGQFTAGTEDVEYFRDKLVGSLGIPRTYLIRSKDSPEDKATLAQKDITFAKTIQRIQKCVISELLKLAQVHLVTLGYKGSDLLSFDVKLNNPSTISEMMELEYLRSKFEVAQAATEGYFSKRWISQHIFNMSDDEYVRNRLEMMTDKKMDRELEELANPQESGGDFGDIGGGGGGIGSELGGGMGGDDMPDLGPEGEGDSGDIGDISPDDETNGSSNDDGLVGGVLFPTSGATGGNADPNNKDYDRQMKQIFSDGSTLTAKSKGKKYTPVDHDRRKTSGPLKKNMHNLAGKQHTGHKALFPGAQTLKSLGKGLINENTNYDEENIMFSKHEQLASLIRGLEKGRKNEK